MNIINTKNAPQAVGPYSQAVIAGDYVFCSGQIGLIPEGKIVEGGIREETKRVLENLKAVLESEDLSFANVVKTEVYLKNIEDFKDMNEIYATFFVEPFPARATIGVANLPKGALVEISCVAYKN